MGQPRRPADRDRRSRLVDAYRSAKLERAMSAQRPFHIAVVCWSLGSAREWADYARRLEELGFGSLLLPDHFGMGAGPLPGLVAAACATTTLRVGTYVLDNDFRHPAVVAQDAATV